MDVALDLEPKLMHHARDGPNPRSSWGLMDDRSLGSLSSYEPIGDNNHCGIGYLRWAGRPPSNSCREYVIQFVLLLYGCSVEELVVD